MARPRNLTPSYLLHSKTCRARLVWTDHTGIRREKLLSGRFGSPESLKAKARFELEPAMSPAASAAAPNVISVAEVLTCYKDCAERYYRDPGGNPLKIP